MHKRKHHCREAEVIHSRWAMLGVLGLIIPDVLGAPLYMLPELGTERLLPFTIIVVTAFGGLEIYRVQSILQGRDLNSRVYPGGKKFDPLGLAKGQASGQQESRSPGMSLLACTSPTSLQKSITPAGCVCSQLVAPMLIMLALTSARRDILFVKIWAARLSVSHGLAEYAILCPYPWDKQILACIMANLSSLAAPYPLHVILLISSASRFGGVFILAGWPAWLAQWRLVAREEEQDRAGSQ